MSPRALPLYHPTADDLHDAHAVYEQREGRAYAYRLARRIVEAYPPIDAFGEIEAVDLLLRIWNATSPHTRRLRLDVIDAVLFVTAEGREVFADRHITSLTEDEHTSVTDIYAGFREVFGPVGAGKALGLLHPRFFPLWDSKIAIAYVGHGFRSDDGAYVTFMSYCLEQCSAAVSEREFGQSLLKVLDEWNYCVWTKGWLPDPR